VSDYDYRYRGGATLGVIDRLTADLNDARREVARLRRIIEDPDIMDRADRSYSRFYGEAVDLRKAASDVRRSDTLEAYRLLRLSRRYQRAADRCERIATGEPAFQVST